MKTAFESVRLIAWAAVLPLAVVACSGKSSSSAPAGRGSPACQSWQGALCSFVSKCGSTSANASTCEEQADGVVCKSDSAATTCATQLNSAACTAPPANCNLTDLADPAAAVAPCNDYLSAACDAEVRCHFQADKASCITASQAQVDCSTIFSVELSYEQCLKDLTTVDCPTLKTSLPTSCNGVLLTNTPKN